MKLYYGADALIKQPVFGKGNPINDYGLGFYLTPNKEMARLWASKNTNGGYLITYKVNINNLKCLNLKRINRLDILRWITILVSHRFSHDEYITYKERIEWLKKNYSIDINEYDLIIGYRADDSYFMYSRDFVANELSINVLEDALTNGELGDQYVLISQKAFNNIKFINAEHVAYSDEYSSFRNKTHNEYLNIKKFDNESNTFIRDLMRGKDYGNS